MYYLFILLVFIKTQPLSKVKVLPYYYVIYFSSFECDLNLN